MVHIKLLRHTLFIIGVISVVAITPQLSEAHNDIEQPITAENITLSVLPTYDEEPLRISIPAAGIDIKIDEAEVEAGTWKVPEHAAGYAQGSAFLDEDHGNPIVFAHARNGLFRNLLNIKSNDEISIIGTKNFYTYRVVSIEKILPDEIDKIKSFGEHNLTLFTCDGVNDQYRLLVKATRISKFSLDNSEII